MPPFRARYSTACLVVASVLLLSAQTWATGEQQPRSAAPASSDPLGQAAQPQAEQPRETQASAVQQVPHTEQVVEPPDVVPADESSAQGDPVDAKAAEAAQRYDRGLTLYAEGEFELAAIEFERAFELVADYRTLYNVGQVRIQLAHYARAHRALSAYLEQGGDRVTNDRRRAVLADLEMLRGRTATLALDVSAVGALVYVDDVLLGETPLAEPLLVNAGTHRIQVRRDGYRPYTAQVTLAGQDAQRLQVKLEAIDTKPTSKIIVERQTTITQAEPKDRTALKWGAWTAAGVFAVGSTITASLGAKAAADLADKRSELGATRAELDSASRRAQTLLTMADVMGVLAIASGGTALYFTLSEKRSGKHTPQSAASGKKPQTTLALRPGSVWITRTY